MRKVIFFLILSLGITSVTAFAEPTNLAEVKKELIRYHDKGQYQKDLEYTLNQASRYLDFRIMHPLYHGKPAIVLDIDETSLSNYPSIVKLSFGGTLDQIQAEEDKGLDPVIQPTLKLYQLAKSNHIAVFFITGRTESERKATIENLHNAGYTQWDGLILRSEADKHLSATLYKTKMRKALTEQGYDIILNIGDQQSDLAGGYADKTYKLANPFYLIP